MPKTTITTTSNPSATTTNSPDVSVSDSIEAAGEGRSVAPQPVPDTTKPAPKSPQKSASDDEDTAAEGADRVKGLTAAQTPILRGLMGGSFIYAQSDARPAGSDNTYPKATIVSLLNKGVIAPRTYPDNGVDGYGITQAGINLLNPPVEHTEDK